LISLRSHACAASVFEGPIPKEAAFDLALHVDSNIQGPLHLAEKSSVQSRL